MSDVADWWQTSIIDMEPGHISIRGEQIQDLIGNLSFAEMVWLMICGTKPEPGQARLLEGALVASVDHGPQAPSIAAARMAVTCGLGLNGAMGSNHRHADFQSAALPTELPGLPAGGTACEDLPKPAEANGITACQHAVQREIEALPASKNSMCAGGYSCSGGLPAPASDSTIESSAPSTAGMA